MIPDELSCDGLSCGEAREQLSARMDGELADERALAAHLERCGACRAHERELAAFARGFEALRDAAPVRDLWPALERRVRPATPLLVRAAAALLGFASLGAAALWCERRRASAAPERHLLEHLVPTDPDALFAALPEYRILRALPHETETR